MRLAATISIDAAVSSHWEVVVIGAGPTGALAALLLARAGKKVLLVDRKTFPRPKVCGGCLSAAGVRLLDRVGLASRLYKAGALPLQRLDVRTDLLGASLPLSGGVSLSRTTLDAVLVDAAIEAGAAFLAGATARVVQNSQYEVALHHDAAGAELESCNLTAQAILIADGLGHPSLRGCERFTESVQPGSRLGAACTLAFRWDAVPRSTVSMNVHRHGYVGLVHVESQQTCVAAALDAKFVRQHHGVSAACAAILQSTGIDVPSEFADASWLGTPALTRQSLRHADENVFLLGDASGYVEPFTGEGMTWAMMSAVDVVPFVQRTMARETAALAWTEHAGRIAARRQRLCRAIAFGLRRPWLVRSTVQVLRSAPNLAQPFVHWITHRRLPELAQGSS